MERANKIGKIRLIPFEGGPWDGEVRRFSIPLHKGLFVKATDGRYLFNEALVAYVYEPPPPKGLANI